MRRATELALVGALPVRDVAPGEDEALGREPEDRRLGQHQAGLHHRQRPRRCAAMRELQRDGEGGGEPAVLREFARREGVLGRVEVEHRRTPAQVPGLGVEQPERGSREAQHDEHQQARDRLPSLVHARTVAARGIAPQTPGARGGAALNRVAPCRILNGVASEDQDARTLEPGDS